MQTQRNELQDQNKKLRQELDQLYSSVGAQQVHFLMGLALSSIPL